MSNRKHRLIGKIVNWKGYEFTVQFVRYEQKGKKSILYVRSFETDWIKISDCTVKPEFKNLNPREYSKEFHEDYVYSDANWSSSDASL